MSADSNLQNLIQAYKDMTPKAQALLVEISRKMAKKVPKRKAPLAFVIFQEARVGR